MPLTPHESRANYAISGADFEPADAAFRGASAGLRRRYWTRVGELAVEAHRGQLRRGQDKDGNPLTPVRRPRPDGADGPPLVPHRAESRTWRLLASVATDRGATIFWRGHGRKSWGEIVKYHAEGAGNLPVRDEIGLSPACQAWVKRRAFAFWEAIAPPKPGARAEAAGRGRPAAAGAPAKLSRADEALARRYPETRRFLAPAGRSR